MVRYRKWRLTGEEISRSTLCMRRKRAEERARAILLNLSSHINIEAPHVGSASAVSDSKAADTAASSDLCFHNVNVEPVQDNNSHADSSGLDILSPHQIAVECKVTEMVNLEVDQNSVNNDCRFQMQVTVDQSQDESSLHSCENEVSACLDLESNVAIDSTLCAESISRNGNHTTHDQAHPHIDDEFINFKKDLSTKLCSCVQTTAGDIVYMCLALGLKHSLTWDAQVDIIKMVSSIFEDADLPKSRKSYLKILDNKNIAPTYHIFCPTCEIYLGKRWDQNWSVCCYNCDEHSEVYIDYEQYKEARSDCEEHSDVLYDCNPQRAVDHPVTIKCSKCQNHLGDRNVKLLSIRCFQCNDMINVNQSSNYYATLSLQKQLQMMLQDEQTAHSLLTYRFKREKISENALEDIYDGEVYKNHFKGGGILSSPSNFSYSFFIDGVQTGKSTCKTMWPVFVTVNELPFKERAQNIMLCGLYVGTKDPNQLTFLKPFVEEANTLSTVGFNWTFKGDSIHSVVIPLCAVADSVARFQILNMQSFHAYYGCTYCYQKQEWTMPRKRRFNMLESADERTPESTFQDAKIAYEKRNEPDIQQRHHRGVKGPSVLMGMLYFNLIWGFAIDYMHAVLLGIVKTHMKTLFESGRKKMWINVNDRVALGDILKSIDQRLLNITPPSSITRVPRSITMWKNWKASEWRSWIVFYCIPCLEGLLKEKYLIHLAILSKAVCMLLQKSITIEEINEVHELLMLYCRMFQKYFDIVDTIYNLHLLTHMKKNVLLWGPVWTQNAFCYEGQNRHLLQLYKAPNNVVAQIARRFLVFASMPVLCDKLVSSYETMTFCENLLEKKLVRFVRCEKAVLAGKVKCASFCQNEKDFLMTHYGVCSNKCVTYNRMIVNGARLTSSHYAKGKQNNDSFVVSKDGKILCINHIILLPTQTIILLGQKVKKTKQLIVSENNIKLQHLRRIKRLGNLLSISLNEIFCQAVVVTTGEETLFVGSVPFGCYGD